MTAQVVTRAVLKSGVGAARYRLTGHRAPLNVTISLTNRCDTLCAYCAAPMRANAELETHEWMGVIDHVAGIGAARIGFAGGEPLLRRDLEPLLHRCVQHGLLTTLETNGHLLPARVDGLAELHQVMISYDGPSEIHDRGRERGAHEKAVAGVEAALAAGLTVSLVTVLGKHNIDAIDHVLAMADSWGVEALFQVMRDDTRGARRLTAANEEIRRAVRTLLEAKRDGRPVGMSEKFLRYLLTWSDFSVPELAVPHEDLLCMAGQVYCAIDADGGVYPCMPRVGRAPAANVRTDGFDAAFSTLRNNNCRACTSTACTEYNFLYNLNAPSVLDAARALLQSPRGSP